VVDELMQNQYDEIIAIARMCCRSSDDSRGKFDSSKTL
jgi:hypothetical protein